MDAELLTPEHSQAPSFPNILHHPNLCYDALALTTVLLDWLSSASLAGSLRPEHVSGVASSTPAALLRTDFFWLAEHECGDQTLVRSKRCEARI